ncbi:MAG: PKD domain-containing protein [Chitinophagaceae bacterium]|nr:MAG: PKD domain-containing protein [Chitinophagaceae bacterium]
MKKTINYMKAGMIILLAGFFMLATSNKINAQACNQVEILHNSPDCLNTRGANGAGFPDQGKDCKAIAVCMGQLYNYSAAGVWASYNWSVTGPQAVTINPNNTSANISIIWPGVGVYTLTLTVTDGSGNTFTTCMTVTVKNKPIANFTFTPNNVCAGSTISFTNTTTPLATSVYSWNFGDPASGGLNYSANVHESHLYAAAGTYTVTLIASSFSQVTVQNTHGGFDTVTQTCCSDTIKKVVTILKGTMTIECISTVCAGDTATYHAIGCANPTWLPPVGGTIIAQGGNWVKIVWGNGAVQGQIIGSCPGGCTASVPVPIIPQNPVPVGNTMPCPNSITSYTLPMLPGTFYVWTLTNITANTTHNNALSTYPDNNTVYINWGAPGLTAGTYELSITLTNKHICCNSTGKLTITPKQKFQAYNNQTICAGSAANLLVSPATGSFNWVVVPAVGVMPPSISGPSTFNPVFNNAGVYTVKVWETGNNFCNSMDTQYLKITVVSTPAPGIINGPNKGCPGSSYSYSMSTPAPPGYYYSWSITPSGSFQPGSSPTATGDAVNVLWTSIPGTITVVLQRNTAPPCPSAQVTLTITQAVIGTISGNQNVCVDDQFQYTLAGGNLPPGENVQWTITPSSLGSVVLGNGTNMPTILWHGQVVGAGPWSAILQASSACGNTSWTINIGKKPVFSLSQSGNVCLGGVTLTATPGYSYVWTPGGQTTNSITVNTIGTFSVAVSNGPCTITKSITVEDPFAIIPKTCGVGHCNGTGTNEQLEVDVIKPGSGTFTYQWFKGIFPSGISMGAPVTNTNLSNTYMATDSGWHYVVVTYGTCSKNVAFYVKKVCCPDVNNPQILPPVRNSCNSFTFTATCNNPNNGTITWDFGDASTATGVSGSPMPHTYAHAGIYCVTFCVGGPVAPFLNPTNCKGNCAVTSVIVPIEAIFSYTLGCNGCISISNNSIVIPTSNLATATYSWNFGDGSPVVTTTSATPPAHCYTALVPTPYTVTLTINYSDPSIPLTCSSQAQTTFTYTPLDISVLPTPVCSGNLVTFSSLPGGFTSYAWNFGDTYSSYVSPTQHAYATVAIPTSYNVTLTVIDQLGVTCTKTKPIIVNPGITSCQIPPKKYICPGGNVTLSTPLVGTNTYQWEIETSPGIFGNAPGVSTNNTYIATTPGKYRVVITNSYGCKCYSNVCEVKASPKPKAIISASNTQLCGPENVTLSTPFIPNYTYAWFKNVLGGAPASVSMTYPDFVTVTTTYFLVVTNQYGCSDTCQLTVTVNPIPLAPIINFSPDLCEGKPITLTVTNYTGNITWNTGANTISIVVYTAGTYTATYTDSLTGCKNSTSIVVNARPPVGLFPHFCDSIPCHCVRPFAIYAPRPLIGTYAVNYTIDWFNANTNTQIFSGISTFNGLPNGVYDNLPNGVQTGSYYVVLTNPMTGCKDTSKTYSVVVPPCDTCDCKESHWGEIELTQGEAVPPIANVPVKLVLDCKQKYKLDCNKPYTFNASYNCKDSACNSVVTYKLQPPTGPAVTGNVAASFTPSITGMYTLTLYGWCGGKLCDSCVIYFDVNCNPCDCKGSKWGEKTVTIDNVAQPITCMKAGEKPIDIKCKKTISINAKYNCADTACNAAVTYLLVQPSGTTTGNVPLTFIANLAGTYSVTLYGWCGGKICDSCVIRYKVDTCSEPCCPYNIAVKDPTIQLSTITNPDATVASASFPITGPAGNLFTEIRAEVMSYNLFSNFNNECLNCKSYPFTWASMYQPGNVGAIPPKITMYNSTAPAFNPSGNGMYQNPREVVWSGTPPFALPANINLSFLLPPASIISCCELTAKICVKFTFRDKDCKECEVISCFIVVIKPGGGHEDPQACKCEINPTLSYEGNNNRPVKCGETVQLFLGNIPVNMNPGFTCKDNNGKDCVGSSVSVMIKKPDNSSQLLTGPNFSYTYLGLSGVYEYTIVGNCGGKKCECKFKVNIP